MTEDEAGYIAMHFVNAQQNGEEMSQTVKVTKMVEDILHIVEYHYQIKLDENSLNYTRFCYAYSIFCSVDCLPKELNQDTVNFILSIKLENVIQMLIVVF